LLRKHTHYRTMPADWLRASGRPSPSAGRSDGNPPFPFGPASALSPGTAGERVSGIEPACATRQLRAVTASQFGSTGRGQSMFFDDANGIKLDTVDDIEFHLERAECPIGERLCSIPVRRGYLRRYRTVRHPILRPIMVPTQCGINQTVQQGVSLKQTFRSIRSRIEHQLRMLEPCQFRKFQF
jgi:hypothetical protein